MPGVLEGFGTRWHQVTASAESQIVDNDTAWQVMFAYAGPNTAMRMIRFAGMPHVDPLQIRRVLIDKQRHVDDSPRGDGNNDAVRSGDRCVLCRLPFGILYDDPTFGAGIRIERNRRNRYYCNICDAFIRICPGQATLVLPVLMVDVVGSRSIRREVGDLRTYSRLVASFQRRIALLIQKHDGFVLNTIGDAVIGVWPSGFVPDAIRERLGWDPQQPARISARQSIAAAQEIAACSLAEFDGARLPMRGALDTTDMVIFSVTTGEPDLADRFRTGSDDQSEVGDPVLGADASDIGTGPAATDIAGQAVETTADLASHAGVPPGAICITRGTDEAARIDIDPAAYRAVEGVHDAVRIL